MHEMISKTWGTLLKIRRIHHEKFDGKKTFDAKNNLPH